MKKILWVKFGWSEYYRGGPIDGNFAWLHEQKNTRKEGRGHEAFNFAPGPDGLYHCYVPPQSGDYAPSCEADPDGWTVVCLAKNPKHTGIHIVGWYEDATLHGEWLPPPEGTVPRRGDTPHPAYDWSYCISSKTAHFVPPERRTMPFSHPSIGQGKYSFLQGPGVKGSDNKKSVLALLEGRIARLKRVAVTNPTEATAPDPQIDPSDPLKGFGTAAHRKEVEVAAEKAVIARYEEKGYKMTRVTHIPCGHDFIFTKGKSVVHVEVKGTSSATEQFFLTRNEHQLGMEANPNWRLAIVTSALSNRPTIREYDKRALKQAFDLQPYVFLGRAVPMTEN